MVKVTLEQDGKKIFEREGEFFVGAMLLNLNEKADYSTCAYGTTKITDIVKLLAVQAIRTLKATSDNWMEYIASIAGLAGALRDFVEEEIEKNPDKLAQGFEELVKDL